MKKKIRILLVILCSIFLTGCMGIMTAKEAVSDYLEMYVTLDSHVIEQLNAFVDSEDLSNEQKEIYKEVLRKQYSTLTYTIDGETYQDDIAYIKTNVNVINLHDIQKESLDYFNEHKEEFDGTDGDYDKSKFLDYKLNEMKKAQARISYEIEFKVVKNDNNWEVSQLSNEDLEKIHGIYEYA